MYEAPTGKEKSTRKSGDAEAIQEEMLAERKQKMVEKVAEAPKRVK